VVGLDHAVLGVDGRAFDQRQQIALHALARDLGAARIGTRGHLVDLVDEDDAVLLGIRERRGLDFVVVDELGGFFFDQQLVRVGDAELANLLLRTARAREQALQLLGHFFHAGRPHDFERGLRVRDLDLDFLVGQGTLTQALAHHLSRGVVGFELRSRGGQAEIVARTAWRRDEDIEHPVFGGVFGAAAVLAHRVSRVLA
jgi:hypothetical protein